jgi:DNA-binding response OmpR family regulator
LWSRWLDAREDGRERSANLRALRGKRVLIADPDEKSARVLTWRLQRLRCGVHRARTASQALKLAPGIDPDVVIADALLADMNAAEFFQSLPRQNIPVVFVGVLRSQWDQIRSLGRDVACLAKPYDPDDVASFAGLAIRRRT